MAHDRIGSATLALLVLPALVNADPVTFTYQIDVTRRCTPAECNPFSAAFPLTLSFDTVVTHETNDPEYVVRYYGAPSFSTVPLERPDVFAGATGFASTADIALVVPPFDWRHVAEAQGEMQVSDQSPAVSPRPLTVKAFGITDTGKVRKTNEDQFLVAELTKSMRVWQTSLPEPKVQVGDERAHLFLVADGMGGHQAGERASALAIAAIEQFTLNTFKWFLGSDSADAREVLAQFQVALNQADVRVVEEAADDPELSGMGTTVTMAFHLGVQLWIAHVGDSRAYLYRDRELDQITQDHTVTAEMVRRGELQPDEVQGHRLRHVITNVVGGGELGVRAEAHAFDVQAGDRLLLCSDGLTEMVPNEAIAATLHAEPSPEAAAKALLSHANEAGGRDNITVLIVRFDPPESDDL